MNYIPYGKQWITEEDIAQVNKILKSDFITTGPQIEIFEKKLSEYVNRKYAVSISSGTAALHAACFVAGIKEDDEVITTPITFAATSNAVLYCGGIPVFADIDNNTYNIDAEDIKRKITERTKAIIPVHFTGRSCEMEKIMKIAQEYKLLVIEDCAHALGGRYNDKPMGIYGDMSIFSFHPVKVITTGEGGAIVTNKKDFYKKLKLFRNHGITRDIKDLKIEDEPWYYEQKFLGFNYRMTDIQAAMGVNQLSKIDKFVERRNEIAKRYDEAFSNCDFIIKPQFPKNEKSAWHLYIIKLNLEKLSCDRKKVFNELRKVGIGVNVHYMPVYYHPYYKQLGYKKGLCPNAENFYEKIITLPLFPKMRNEEIDYVIENVFKTVNKFKK